MQDNVKDSFEKNLNKLSLLVIDIDQNDPHEFANIHECFKQLRELKEFPKEHITTIDSVMKTIEDVIFEECPFQRGVEIITESISKIQNTYLGTAKKRSSR